MNQIASVIDCLLDYIFATGLIDYGFDFLISIATQTNNLNHEPCAVLKDLNG